MKENRARKIWTIASAGVLVLAVIAALIIFFLPADKPNSNVPATAASTASAAPAETTPPVDATGVGCKAPASDNREVPADLRWAAGNGITWPVSDTVGPTTTTDGFAACFEHSPVGAALAAVAITLSTTERTQLDTAKFYLAPSPGRDAVLADTDPTSLSPIKDQLEDGGLSLVGFRVEEYDGDRASIRLVLRVPGSSTGYRGIPSPMVWVDGDWKLKPLDDGTTGQPSDESMDDFTYLTADGNG